MDSTIADVVHRIEYWAGEHIRMLEEHLKRHPNRLPDAPVGAQASTADVPAGPTIAQPVEPAPEVATVEEPLPVAEPVEPAAAPEAPKENETPAA